MNQIIPGISIGNWPEARDHAHEFDLVVNVSIDAPNSGGPQFPLVDGPGNSAELFDAAVNRVVDAHRIGLNVLIHCVQGRSRSGAVVTRAIMRLQNVSCWEAYAVVRGARDEISIHPAFAEFIVRAPGGVQC